MMFPQTFRSASTPRRHAPTALFALAAAAGAALAAPGDAWAQSVDVTELTVAQIQSGFTAGTFTSQTLTSSFFDRINQFEPTYNAFISFNPDAAAQAAASDARRAAGASRGPLDGVPVVVKDNMDYAGLPTTNGYAGFDSRDNGIDIIPGTDSSVVARLKAAGAVILGKTNLPDFANDGLRSNSSNEGITRNPSAFTKVPGGSSGGTATAVNASFAVLGLGTETGRSIHNPSGFQALVGVRPSQGLVPIDGIAPLNGTFRDVAGPIAKTVYDAAVTLDALAGPSARDRLSANSEIPVGGYTSKLSTSALNGARVGYFDNGFLPVFSTVNGVRTATFRNTDAPTASLYNAAIAAIEGQGATIVRDDFFGSDWVNHYGAQPTLASSQAFDQYTYLQQLGDAAAFNTIEEYIDLVKADPNVPDTYAEDFRRFAPAVSDTVDPLSKPAAQAWLDWRATLRSMYDVALEDFDLDAFAYPINGKQAPELFGGANNDPLVQGTVNILGIPGVIVPAGYYDDGTPFGVIFMGERWDEADLLGLAFDYEQATLLRDAPTLIPEPAGLALLALGGTLLARRRRVA